jgi:hypothetical protein
MADSTGDGNAVEPNLGNGTRIPARTYEEYHRVVPPRPEALPRLFTDEDAGEVAAGA